jgi:hypothetical protein
LQRRRGVVTLQLHLANGRLSLPFLEQGLAMDLADQLLATTEGLSEEGVSQKAVGLNADLLRNP